MNKKTLAKKLARDIKQSRRKAEAIVDLILDYISQALAENKKVRLVGFGNFVVRTRKGRIGVNPRTKEQMEIKPSKCPSFVPGFNLKKAVKGEK